MNNKNKQMSKWNKGFFFILRQSEVCNGGGGGSWGDIAGVVYIKEAT